MKKYFFKYMFDDLLRFLALMLVFFSPFFIWLVTRWGFEGGLLLIFWTVLAYVHVIISYKQFKPEVWKREKELKEKFDRLSLNKKEKLLGNKK